MLAENPAKFNEGHKTPVDPNLPESSSMALILTTVKKRQLF
jgi:hypothetical protein